jgi:hypothetical protein
MVPLLSQINPAHNTPLHTKTVLILCTHTLTARFEDLTVVIMKVTAFRVQGEMQAAHCSEMSILSI